MTPNPCHLEVGQCPEGAREALGLKILHLELRLLEEAPQPLSGDLQHCG